MPRTPRYRGFMYQCLNCHRFVGPHSRGVSNPGKTVPADTGYTHPSGRHYHISHTYCPECEAAKPWTKDYTPEQRKRLAAFQASPGYADAMREAELGTTRFERERKNQ